MLLAALLCCGPAAATSVLEVSLPEMVTNSECVFEGRVVEVTPGLTSDRQAVQTRVVFEVIDVLKGELGGPTVTLVFLGGTLGGRTLRVVDMVLPQLGETGIYFVESLNRPQVHPLYGWQQGHLRTVTDSAGAARVTSAKGKAVVAVEPVARRTVRSLSKGVARGIVARETASAEQAMTVTAFKRQVRALLQSDR